MSLEYDLFNSLSKTQMAAALECSGESIVITDNAGIIQYVNPSFTLLSGFSRTDVLGKRPSYWRSDRHAPAFYEDLWACILRGNVWHGEVTNRRKDSSLYDALVSIAPIWDEHHAPVGYVASISDISSYKKLQKELRQACDEAQRETQARKRNLAYLSHDIRTPLNGLLGIISILEETQGQAERLEYIATMKRAGQSILALVENILDESKMDARKLQLENVAFDFLACLRDAQQLLGPKAAELKSVITINAPGQLPLLMGDPQRLARIFQNLIGNSVKFTEKGDIKLNLTVLAENPTNLELQLEIEDNGIGISESALPKLFQDFSQADESIARTYGGTGLGLTITKKFVELMGGKISVKSRLGLGTTMTLVLPFAKARFVQAHAPHPGTPEPDPSFPDKVALVCDDDEISRKILQRHLEKRGMTVDLVCNGKESLNRISNKNYDIIFTDLQMPLMDGVTMAQHIHKVLDERHIHTPIIAVTGATQLRQNEAKAFDHMICKPISASSIGQALLRFLPTSSQPG